jgi:ABC-2 type transport system ATP-binding protein
MRVDSGRIMLDDLQLHRDMEVLPSLGMVIEHAGLYDGLTGFQNLKKLASYKKCISEEEMRDALCRVGLDPDDRRKYYKYSLGMKQRLAIAQAIMEHPDVLMLDEPTNALDEEGIERIRRIILEEKERGAIVMLASHSREDMELLADQVYTMREGELLL